MLGRRFAELQIAVMLLSRLSAGKLSGDVPSLAASVWAWPMVGMLIGALGGACFWGLHVLGFPPLIIAILTVAVTVLATGGLHEDGLADLADGLGGGADRARKLEIMRDSRIGSYGVLALILTLVLRIAVFAELTEVRVMPFVIVACAAASRSIMPLWLYLLPPARPDGLGRSAGKPSAVAVAISLSCGAIMLGLLLPSHFLTVYLAMLTGSVTVAWLAWRQIGGQSGDVLGASQQIAELAGWLALVFLVRG